MLPLSTWGGSLYFRFENKAFFSPVCRGRFKRRAYLLLVSKVLHVDRLISNPSSFKDLDFTLSFPLFNLPWSFYCRAEGSVGTGRECFLPFSHPSSSSFPCQCGQIF